MKPILLIDFYKTLSSSMFWGEEYRLQIKKVLFVENSDIINDWMRGKYSSEEVNKIVAGEAGIDYDKLWRSFVDSCETFLVDQESLRLIAGLRDNYRVVIATDNMDSFNRFTVLALGLEKHFDLISNSFDRQKLKGDNNGEVFLDIVRELGGDIKEAILCDDSAEVCDIFEQLGGKAYRISPENTLKMSLDDIASKIK